VTVLSSSFSEWLLILLYPSEGFVSHIKKVKLFLFPGNTCLEKVVMRFPALS
jgi:hypothetical protein